MYWLGRGEFAGHMLYKGLLRKANEITERLILEKSFQKSKIILKKFSEVLRKFSGKTSFFEENGGILKNHILVFGISLIHKYKI